MKPDFNKYTDGLVPAIIQDESSNKVLMLGFMNEEALIKTRDEGKVTFYSRTKQRLWTKGESSGNYLSVKDIRTDCDNDTLLIKVETGGPVCHTGEDTCFKESNPAFSLAQLESIIADRKARPADSSYTASLFLGGINKIAQKLGEEAVEVVIASKDDDPERFLEEAGDLLFHFLVLLQQKNCRLCDVIKVLGNRNSIAQT